MANVIRLSKRQLDLLEQYRTIEVESEKIMAQDFPNHNIYVKQYQESDIQELLTSALSTAVFYSEENLKGMKKGI